MKFVSNEDFRKAKEQYIGLLKKVLFPSLKFYYSAADINMLADEILFDCLRLFEDQGYKFTTYLQISAVRKRNLALSKAKKRESQLINEKEVPYETDERLLDLKEVLEILKKEDPKAYEIVFDKYYNRLSNVEIGKKNGYSAEYARQKIKKAINRCQNIVYS